ncbi:MAG: lysylphosphatidylglycerol synthase domain-containing protein [Polyangiaceae bacterium]
MKNLAWSTKLLRLAPPLLGLAAMAGLAHFVGADEVKDGVVRASAWLPLLLLIEGARIPLEASATRNLLGKRSADVSLLTSLRAQLLFYSVSTFAPGGRVLGEAAKAALLSPCVGVSTASAVATGSQAGSLIADALVALAGALALYALFGWSTFTALTLGFVLACVSLGALLLLFQRHLRSLRWLGRFPRLARAIGSFHEALQKQRLFNANVVATLVLARLGQALFFGVALFALGGGFSLLRSLALLSLVMAGAVAGEAVPAQLGTADAVLVAAASAFSLAPAKMATLGVLFHITQLSLAGLSALAAAALHGDVPGSARGDRGAATVTDAG